MQSKTIDIILDKKSISNYGIFIKKFYEICFFIIYLKKEDKPDNTENYLPLVKADISNFTICSLGSL